MTSATTRSARLTLTCSFGLLAACSSAPLDVPPASSSAEASGSVQNPPAIAPETADAEPEIISEHDDRLSIRLPAGLDAYPALARTVRAAADSHRREMLAHAAGIAEEPDLPEPMQHWSLEIDYSAPAGSGGLRVVAGEGYVYTGGAHGMPVIERYTYHIGRERVLELSDWFTGDDIWTALSEYARGELIRQGEALHAEYGGDPEEQGFWIEMIEGGTEPHPGSFSIYEPILDDTGSVTALRLIFPPYQVAPYVEGPKSVDVPSHAFHSHLAPDLATLVATEAASGS